MFYLSNDYQLHQFDSKAEEGVFIGYSTTIKAYKVYNKRTLDAEESGHVPFDESNSFYPKHEHENEEANIVTLESNPSPNNEAPLKR